MPSLEAKKSGHSKDVAEPTTDSPAVAVVDAPEKTVIDTPEMPDWFDKPDENAQTRSFL